MSDISPRRRFTGRAAIATAFLAVPLTASVCYAEGAPAVFVASAQAAEASVDEWTDADVQHAREEQVEVDVDREFDEAHAEMLEAEREMDEAHREIVEIEREMAAGDSKTIMKRRISVNGKDWDELSPGERDRLKEEMAQLRQQFAEGSEFQMEMKRLREEFAENGKMRREIRLAMAEAREASANAPKVVVSCRDEMSPVTSETDADGKTTLFVCETAGEKIALKAMRQARSAIAAERSLSAEEREEALRSLDAEIAEIERKQ